MARPRRMGAFNALDELLPGPASDRPRLEAVSAQAQAQTRAGAAAEAPAPRERKRKREPEPEPERGRDRQAEPVEEPRRGPGFNALDELLPGPLAPRPRLQLVPDRSRGRGRGRSQHLSAYNPLDGLQPEPPAPKARVSLRVTAELLEAARDASAYLSGAQSRMTLGDLAEDALRAELQRLAVEHNSGRPFPPRPDDPKGGRPAAR